MQFIKTQYPLHTYEFPQLVAVPEAGRAMYISDDRLYFCNSKGQIGCYSNDTLLWLRTINDTLDLRGIVRLSNGKIIVINAGTPAYVWVSEDEGITWKRVWEDHHPEIFNDAIIRDEKDWVYILGDPIDNCFQLMYSTDGGSTFSKYECSNIPISQGKEACFASSNTSMGILHDRIYFVTGGGNRARLLHELGEAENERQIYETPILQNGKMQGIYSMDISTNGAIIIAGGDYENQNLDTATIAISNDGGFHWQLLNQEIGPSYISCVQFHPHDDNIIAAGGNGLWITYDKGNHWQLLKAQKINCIRWNNAGTKLYYSI